MEFAFLQKSATQNAWGQPFNHTVRTYCTRGQNLNHTYFQNTVALLLHQVGAVILFVFSQAKKYVVLQDYLYEWMDKDILKEKNQSFILRI